MKKIIYLISAILLFSCNNEEVINSQEEQKLSQRKTSSIDGDFISREQAESVAINFFSQITKLKPEEIKIQSTEIIDDYNKEIAVYTVNIEPKGFVLVSSNLKNIPIIAYSDSDSFKFDNNAPDGLKSWIAESIMLGDELEKIEKPINDIRIQWTNLGISFRAPNIDDEIIENAGVVNNQYGPLLQTTWGQGDGYNNLCPQLGCSNYTNGRAPSGCVATATAQVMKYHNWPNSFLWSSMPNYYGTYETSRLMKDIGDKVGMNYTCDGSGTQTENARNVLVNDYGYSNYASFGNYNLNTTKVEIVNNRPVIMSGYHSQTIHDWWFFQYTTYQDGHAWVCDGFREYYIRLICLVS